MFSRISALGGVVGAISAVGLIMYSVFAVDSSNSSQSIVSQGEAQDAVDLLLWNRKQAWNLRAQKSADRKLVDELQHPKRQAALLAMLAKGKHPMMLEVVRAAGLVGLRGSIPYLRARWRAGPMLVRAMAFDALDRMVPWSPGEMYYHLTAGDEAGVRGALLVARRRSALPAVVLVAALGHSTAEVAELVVSAIPRPLDFEACEELMKRLDATSSRSLAALVLRRCRITGAVELCLTQWVDRAPRLRGYILTALARKAGPLDNPQPVLDLASGASTRSSVDEILALRCLERTRTPFSVAMLKAGLGFRAPAVRYHAARLLLTRGDRAGLDVLLELLDVTDWKDDDIGMEPLLKTYRECCGLATSIFGATPAEILADLETHRARVASIVFDPPPPTTIDLHGG